MRRLTLLLTLCLVLTATAAFAQPNTMGYQGQLLEAGAAYTGNADFKFAIVDGGLTLWSNDLSSSVGDEPGTPVTYFVDNGSFAALLGDANNGQVPLTADFLYPSGNAVLRVWVDTGSGFEQLTDIPLASVAFSMQSDAANRSLGDFIVPGEVQLGVGLRFPDNTLQVTASTGTGGADTDWVIQGNDMFSGVVGNVGIGTAAPTEKLTVNGNSLFDTFNGTVEITTPGGWPGFVAHSPSGDRRDIIFDDSSLRLLVGADSNPPGPATGITIRETGYVGIGNNNPVAHLDVGGAIHGDALRLDQPGFNAVHLWYDGVTGGSMEMLGPGGFSDKGITMTASTEAGGGVFDLYNAATAPTVEFLGEWNGGGLMSMSDGSTISLQDQGVGGVRRSYNNQGTKTLETLGQAFGGGSQITMYDANGTGATQFTAANREMKVWNDQGQVQILWQADNSGGQMNFYQMDGQIGVAIDGDSAGDGEIRLHDSNGSATVRIVGEDGNGNGRIITDVLEITGGADLSENFDINVDAGFSIEPGMVVCIDPVDPGKLVPSEYAYARTVAGIVSGAGGVRPGMLMGQAGSVADGAHPVALTGRVWTRCDTSNGAIQPGDLLTTSNHAGQAMRVTDHAKATGAVIGKAMSGLEAGDGLVLVLVSLQ